MGTTVLVTGARTPMGRYVADAFGDHGDRVVADDAADGRLDLPGLLNAIREHAARHLVYTAGAADPCVSIKLPVPTVVANVESVLHVLEASRLAGVEGRIVLLSSSAVYGDTGPLVDESTPVRPRTPLAAARVTEEQLGMVYSQLYGLDVVVLRIGEPFGPELAVPSIVASLIGAAIEGEPFSSPAGGEHAFNLTHGDDIARAVLLATRAAEPTQRIYNISGGELHSVAEIAAVVRDLFPLGSIDVGSGHVSGLDRQGRLDIRAADRDLGYRPFWGLARGVSDYAEWLDAQREAA